MKRISVVLALLALCSYGCLGPAHSVKYEEQEGDKITTFQVENKGGLFGKTVGNGQGAVKVGEGGEYEIVVGQEATTDSDAEKMIEAISTAFQAGFAAAAAVP